MTINQIVDLFESTAVITASILAIRSIHEWRREGIWKRKYELAESIISEAQNAVDKMKLIRNDIFQPEELKFKLLDPQDLPEHLNIIRVKGIINMRYEAHKEPFLNLRKLKYKAIAIYGEQEATPIQTIIDCIDEVLKSADLYVKYMLWYKNEKDLHPQDSNRHYELANKNKSIIFAGHEEDSISDKLTTALLEIDRIYRPVININTK